VITLKNLQWSNAFSYGSNNEIALDKDPITQLVGKNGHGKSSIALILEEVLYNKNSKGIKKADILNRYTKDKTYTIELQLEKDGVLYTVKTVRGTTQSTVKLFKENLDISSHTATQTYKSIEELIGMDHKAFSQIVYQSNASSLEFLTSTDSVRKKFLIDLLDLGIYTKAGELFKQLSTDLNKEIAACQAKVNTVSGWLNKYIDVDLTRKVLVEEPEIDPQLEQTVAEQSAQLLVVEQTNKKIAQNNSYKKMLGDIVLQPVVEPTNQTDIVELRSQVAVLNQQNKDADLFIKKLNSLTAAGRCPICDGNIDTTTTKALIQQKQNIVASNKAKLLDLDAAIQQAQTLLETWAAANKQQEQWERLHQLIDPQLQETFLDKTTIASEIDALNVTIKQAKAKLKQAQDYNKTAETHNAQLTLIESQLQEFKQDLETYTQELDQLTDRSNTIGVLTKTFSTSGLVAYKIESLVKDLEMLANEFLQELSDGRFQIGFEISSKDKLNVVITDNSKDIDIMALSGGERARVNAAMLLAIRKLMQSLSSSRINLLILDETIEALDVDGKEKLIDTLIKEPGLNTFLVSHGFTHPLLEKLYVVKHNNVSRIEA
jgi:DNA repair exonuclease SbcCD ATPase subunit